VVQVLLLWTEVRDDIPRSELLSPLITADKRTLLVESLSRVIVVGPALPIYAANPRFPDNSHTPVAKSEVVLLVCTSQLRRLNTEWSCKKVEHKLFDCFGAFCYSWLRT
jgi:hypothetical protein